MSHSHGNCFKITCYKTGSYAVMHLMVAITVAYLLTRDWRAALAIGLIEPLVQTVAFYFHDRAWSKHENTQGTSAANSVELRRSA
ncbi:DUF2061 domain-containing protein [Qipengyuania sp. MTN3-11]|uniref:DUF2061 domain-containing protein n=1 Tax=Qipengyuania sp. MTN3-11 TaxID=3056557 RepID=UPI0036F402E9